MNDGRLRPSNRVLVSFDILRGNSEPSPLNQVYRCYGHPEDGPAELALCDEDGVETTIQVQHITSLEENPQTGSTHFTGVLTDGGSVSGHFLKSPGSDVVGQATIAL